MSMQMLINDACRARESARSYPIYDDYDDYDRPDPAQAKQPEVIKPVQIIPKWLTAGLQHYVDLANIEDGTISPSDPDEALGHLSASAQTNEAGTLFEVVSDVLYIPKAAKVGKSALRGNAYVVQTVFGLGLSNGEQPAVKPRLALNLVQLGEEGRDAIVRASEGKSAGTPRLAREDLLDEAGNLNSLVKVKSGIKKIKTDPQIKNPKLKAKAEGKWAAPTDLSKSDASVLLSELLKPKLRKSVVRVKAEVPIN